MKKYLLISFLLIIISFANAQTTVSGGIYSNTTWTKANSPYIVNGALTLFPNDTLTIEPGVIVKFDNGIGFEVRGTIISIGTPNDYILFTSSSAIPSQGIWNGIFINNNLGASGQIQYSIFRYGGYGIQNACCWGGGPLNISHSRFENNVIGVDGYAGWVVPIDSCYFSNNMYAITRADKIIRNSNFINNTYGLYQTERIGVYNCNFCQNGTALYGGRNDLQNSIIMNNGIGVLGFFEGFTNVTGNIIAQNDTGIVLTGNSIDSNNTICSNTYYNLINGTASNLSVKNNCWCDTIPANISQKIYDGYDDISRGLIDFSSYLICNTSIIPSEFCSSISNGIDFQIQENNPLSFFPNPSSDKITISNYSFSDKEARVEIYNMMGEKVFQSEIKNEKSEMDVSWLAKGIYIIQLIDGERVFRGKMIKE